MKSTAKAPSHQVFLESPSQYVALRRIEPSSEVDELAHKVIGAAIEVHRALGPGYGENVYEEALTVELNIQSIPLNGR